MEMKWKKISPKLIKSLKHGQTYLLAYNYCDKWEFVTDTWWKFGKHGHFSKYTLPKMIAEIPEPEVK